MLLAIIIIIIILKTIVLIAQINVIINKHWSCEDLLLLNNFLEKKLNELQRVIDVTS